MVPLAVKDIQGIQRFRIPFKNLSTQELDIEFQFLKTCSGWDRTKFVANQQASPLELSVSPTTIKMGS